MERILVCEDEEDLRKIFVDYFQDNEYQVICAADGEEGLKLINSEKPDIMLLDMRMPRLDGYGTLKKLRETNKELPVIVITAYGYICQVIQMMNLGISGYVTKPIDFDKLLEKIKEILAVQKAGEAQK
ncbi:MAG: response regulator [Candidatus Wallbacteria bacterium]